MPVYMPHPAVLQSEYTAAKQLLGQQQERYGALQAEHSQLLERHHQSEKLVSQLEADLLLVRPLLPSRDVSVSLMLDACCLSSSCRVIWMFLGLPLKSY